MKNIYRRSLLGIFLAASLFATTNSYAIFPMHRAHVPAEQVVTAVIVAPQPPLAEKAATPVMANEGNEITTLTPALPEPVKPVKVHHLKNLDRLENAAIALRHKFFPRYHDTESGGGIKGILAFILGLCGLGLFVGGFISLLSTLITTTAGTISYAFVVFFIAAFFVGMAATILGAMGIKHKFRGFAIAGMVLGIIDMVFGGIASLITLLVS